MDKRNIATWQRYDIMEIIGGIHFFIKKGKNNMFKKIIAFTLTIALSLCLLIQTATSASVSTNEQGIMLKLQEFMTAMEENKYFHGSILVSQNGKVMLNQAYGMADYEMKIKNTPKTSFPIGSLTKQFTATGILLLQEKGLLSVNDKISKYIKDFPDGNDITLFQLLDHSSGIVNYTTLTEILANYKKYSKAEDIISVLKKEKLNFNPGSKYEYSNSNYVILGYIIEKVSKLSYIDFLKKNIFMPLKMNDTGACYVSNKKEYTSKGYSGAEKMTFIEDEPLLKIAFGAGCLYSTTGDLYLWDKALTSGKVVNKKVLDKIYNGQIAIDNSEKYGYGWIAVSDGNGKTLTHTGATLAFTSYNAINLTKNFTVIILTNSSGYDIAYPAKNISAILLNQEYEIPVANTTVNLPSELLDKYVGSYNLSPQVIVNITKKNDSLFIQLTGQSQVQLYAESETMFFTKLVDAKIEFVINDKGEVDSLIIHQNGADVPAVRVE